MRKNVLATIVGTLAVASLGLFGALSYEQATSNTTVNIGATLVLKSETQTSNGWSLTLTLANTGNQRITQWTAYAYSVSFLSATPSDGWAASLPNIPYTGTVYFTTNTKEYYLSAGQSQDVGLLVSTHGFSTTWYIQQTQGGKPGSTAGGVIIIP